MPECPHCDTALAPEPIAPGVWLCLCCALVFRTPLEPECPAATPAPAEGEGCQTFDALASAHRAGGNFRQICIQKFGYSRHMVSGLRRIRPPGGGGDRGSESSGGAASHTAPGADFGGYGLSTRRRA